MIFVVIDNGISCRKKHPGKRKVGSIEGWEWTLYYIRSFTLSLPEASAQDVEKKKAESKLH